MSDQNVKDAQAAAVDWDALDNDAAGGAFPNVEDTLPPHLSGPDVRPAAFQQLVEDGQAGPRQGIDLLRDVEVELTVELGSTRMLIKHILGLRPGSVVELNRLAGEPVDIVINKTLIARGEVVVVDEKFAIRVVEIVPPERRLGAS